MQSTTSRPKDRRAWAAAFDHSPLTAKAYAAQAGYATATLYYWRNKLTAEAAIKPTGFTQLSLAKTETVAEPLYLRLPSGIEVHGSPGALVDFAQALCTHA